MAEDVTLSVSDAVELAKGQVSRWPSMTVVGEVSGFRGPNARSGHCYFEVKDSGASMSVIVWRGTHQKLSFELRDGLEVQLTGKFDIYKGSGRMSFVASRVEASGEGLLRQRIAELARRLQVEGLMDDRRKRPIPAFCSRVCVVTSLSGSVIEDVKRTLARRNPLVLIDVADLRVADGADHKVTVDGSAALGADAVVGELVLAQGDVQVLLLAVDEVGARAQDDVGEQAHDGDDGDDGPHPPGLGTAALGVADDVDDGEDVQHDDADDHEVEHHANLRGDELVEQFLHVWDSFL